jgi:hypothetical protein
MHRRQLFLTGFCTAGTGKICFESNLMGKWPTRHNQNIVIPIEQILNMAIVCARAKFDIISFPFDDFTLVLVYENHWFA